MRLHLAALATLVAAVTLYQGLVLGGYVDGPGPRLDREPAMVLLAAGGALALATVTLRWAAGIAAGELVLAGAAVLGLGATHPDHRYLLVYGGVTVVLGMGGAAIGLAPDREPRRTWQSLSAPAGVRARPPVPARGRRHHLLRLGPRPVVGRIAQVRRRQASARHHWRAWPIGPSQGRHRGYRGPWSDPRPGSSRGSMRSRRARRTASGADADAWSAETIARTTKSAWSARAGHRESTPTGRRPWPGARLDRGRR